MPGLLSGCQRMAGDHPRGGFERRDGGGGVRGGLRAVGRACVRPAERPHHAGGLLRHRVRGGFSYADVLESARGWEAMFLINKELKAHFDAFYDRPDTSLALLDICNGCQWLPADDAAELWDRTLNPIISVTLCISFRNCMIRIPATISISCDASLSLKQRW